MTTDSRFRYDFTKLRLPHEVLVAYHEHVVSEYGPRNLESTCEEEERDLSVLWIIEDAMDELRSYGWSRDDIAKYVLEVADKL